jgi:hypothetical protein
MAIRLTEKKGGNILEAINYWSIGGIAKIKFVLSIIIYAVPQPTS